MCFFTSFLETELKLISVTLEGLIVRVKSLDWAKSLFSRKNLVYIKWQYRIKTLHKIHFLKTLRKSVLFFCFVLLSLILNRTPFKFENLLQVLYTLHLWCTNHSVQKEGSHIGKLSNDLSKTSFYLVLHSFSFSSFGTT